VRRVGVEGKSGRISSEGGHEREGLGSRVGVVGSRAMVISRRMADCKYHAVGRESGLDARVAGRGKVKDVQLCELHGIRGLMKWLIIACMQACSLMLLYMLISLIRLCILQCNFDRMNE